MTQPCPVPDDPRIDELVRAWPDPTRWPYRSRWLHDIEAILRAWYPQASSRSIALTARNLAPFPLAQPGKP